MFNATLNKIVRYTLFVVGIIIILFSLINLVTAFTIKETEFMIAAIITALYGIGGGCVAIVFAKLSFLLDYYIGIKSTNDILEEAAREESDY